MANTLLEVLRANNDEIHSEKELDRVYLTEELIEDFKKCKIKKGISNNSGVAYFYIETSDGCWCFLPRDWQENPMLEIGDAVVVYKKRGRGYICIERQR